MAQDWKQELAARFDKLATTAAPAPVESKGVNDTFKHTGLRGVKCIDGEERLIHRIVEPQRCVNCGLTGPPHGLTDCIRELKAALAFATGNVQIVRQ